MPVSKENRIYDNILILGMILLKEMNHTGEIDNK